MTDLTKEDVNVSTPPPPASSARRPSFRVVQSKYSRTNHEIGMYSMTMRRKNDLINACFMALLAGIWGGVMLNQMRRLLNELR